MVPQASSKFLVLATTNRGKVLEFQTLLAPARFTLLTPKEIGFTEEVEETGTTFEQNALIKAQALASWTPYPILSDDSGLEVDALGGVPGVYSARYATDAVFDSRSGQALPQAAANRAKLLKALEGRLDRTSRFRCILCWLMPGQKPTFFAGVCEGQIANSERGEGGFGYDSIFIPSGFDQTFGELSHAVKDRLSHRAQAVSLLLESEVMKFKA